MPTNAKTGGRRGGGDFVAVPTPPHVIIWGKEKKAVHEAVCVHLPRTHSLPAKKILGGLFSIQQ